jgi:hypothetical protein
VNIEDLYEFDLASDTFGACSRGHQPRAGGRRSDRADQGGLAERRLCSGSCIGPAARRSSDTEKRQIVVEYTLEARNEKSSGGVFDLMTAAA